MFWLLELDIDCTLVKGWFEKVRNNEIQIALAATLTSTMVHHFLARDSDHNDNRRIACCYRVLNLLSAYHQLNAEVSSSLLSPGGGQEDVTKGDYDDEVLYTSFRNGSSISVFSIAFRSLIICRHQPGFLTSIERKPLHCYLDTPAKEAELEDNLSSTLQ